VAFFPSNQKKSKEEVRTDLISKPEPVFARAKIQEGEEREEGKGGSISAD
jgi:hypothetical protein